MARPEEHYSAHDIESRLLHALRAAGLNPDERIPPERLAALDHFHTGGLEASRELLDLARIRAEHRVLEIGAGLGGAARLIASSVGCRVDCLELSPDYCDGARFLNRITGLEGQIDVHQGSALETPFPDGSFDVVWMQNVGMNIEDKRQLYTEIHRVLTATGRFAFQEIAAGATHTSYFPLPWASEPADSFLVDMDEMDRLLSECGLSAELFEDVSQGHLDRKSPATDSGGLTLSIYVDDLAEKGGNARRSLEEGQIRLVRGVFRPT